MTNALKERITDDLQKAKAEGTLRTDRIRDILKTAVAQAATELKAGSGEIRGIARDAIAAVIEMLKGKGEGARTEVKAAVEGVVDGIRESQAGAIAQAQAQVEHTQTQVDVLAQTLEQDIDSALGGVEASSQDAPKSMQSSIEEVVASLRDSKHFETLRQQYLKFKDQLAALDARLQERYGDRYTTVKQQLEHQWQRTSAWYSATKARVEAGEPDPVQQTQAKLTHTMNEAAVAAARKEAETKQHVQEWLQNHSQS